MFHTWRRASPAALFRIHFHLFLFPLDFCFCFTLSFSFFALTFTVFQPWHLCSIPGGGPALFHIHFHFFSFLLDFLFVLHCYFLFLLSLSLFFQPWYLCSIPGGGPALQSTSIAQLHWGDQLFFCNKIYSNPVISNKISTSLNICNMIHCFFGYLQTTIFQGVCGPQLECKKNPNSAGSVLFHLQWSWYVITKAPLKHFL